MEALIYSKTRVPSLLSSPRSGGERAGVRGDFNQLWITPLEIGQLLEIGFDTLLLDKEY